MSKKKKCDQCDRLATHHSIEISGGEKIEKHLCDVHAAEEGMSAGDSGHVPINELLTNFVKIHAGIQEVKPAEVTCENCGLTFSKFREKSLLGCPECYSAFEGPLSPMLERAHEGATHHVGKVPQRAGVSQQRQVQLARMRKKLHAAVEAEDYESAANLRDQLKNLEDDA